MVSVFIYTALCFCIHYFVGTLGYGLLELKSNDLAIMRSCDHANGYKVSISDLFAGSFVSR